MGDTTVENRCSRPVELKVMPHNESSASIIKIDHGKAKTLKLGSGVARITTEDLDAYAPTGTPLPIEVKDDGIYYEGQKLPNCGCNNGIDFSTWKWVIIAALVAITGIVIIRLSKN